MTTKEMAIEPDLVAVIINDGVIDDLSHKTETKQMVPMPDLVSGAAGILPTVTIRPAWV